MGVSLNVCKRVWLHVYYAWFEIDTFLLSIVVKAKGVGPV